MNRFPFRVVPVVALAVFLAGVGSACAGKEKRVRPPALAGSWYPGPRALAMVQAWQMMRDVRGAPALPGPPRVLVVPHAGWRYSGPVAAAAFRNLRPGRFRRVVVVAPSHRGGFEGYDIGDYEAWKTPLGTIPVCRDAVARLRGGGLVRAVPGVDEREHSIEIELPFLQERLGKFCLVPVLTGRVTPDQQKEMARRLAKLDDGKTLFVFSSDFTHYGPRYGYMPFGRSAPAVRARIRDLDERAVALILAGDAAGFREFLSETGDTICGRMGLATMLELLPLLHGKLYPVRLATWASIDIPGFEDDNSVTYVAIAWTGKPARDARPLLAPPRREVARPGRARVSDEVGRRLVRVARAALETQLRERDDLHRELASLPDDPVYDREQAVFVTLNRTDPEEIRRRGRLRGCIGQIWPSYPLLSATVLASLQAALADRRFTPVRPEELDRVAVEVTVLTPPRPVDSWQEIELGRHGIVIQKDGRRAVFLPQVPGEQGWDLPTTLTHLARKAGLPGDAWKDPDCRFQVFEGQVFHERRKGMSPGGPGHGPGDAGAGGED